MTMNPHSFRKKILVADDNPAVIETIFQYFNDTRQPYELLNACNGSIAYQVAREELPDLIILDWEMPMLSGLEVIGYLKKQEETRHIPIIIATGAQIEDRNLEEALETGAIDYIRKPFSRIELLARSKAAMRMSALHQREKILLQSVIDAQNRELSTIALQVAQKNELLDGVVKKLQPIASKDNAIKSYLKTLQNGLSLDNQWDKFKLHFEKVHPHFFARLQQNYPVLSPNELKLCAYMKMNLSVKETMQILNISKKGLETARYRMKKKLNLKPKDDLPKLMQQF
ncbi:response regulator [uncultured Microscilla sp.]|uniref:DNA-binding response regulator n=1 Tax=uncultured Microscilla sp. TaxID=432653 RepID=UPI002621D18B|nr:response regulator [uncultured Microscilla sp.]